MATPRQKDTLEMPDVDSDEDWIGSKVGLEPMGCVETPIAKPSMGKARPSIAPSVKSFRMSPYMTTSEAKKHPVLPDSQPEFPTPVHTPIPPSVATSVNGVMSLQPVTPPVPEPFENSDVLDEIPDIQDPLAPRFKVGEHHLSPEAIRSRSKRIFTPRANGSKKVSEEIWNDWKAGGNRKKLLEEIFKRCGYDPETRLIGQLFCSLKVGLV